MLIGLTGKKRRGKDTVANYIVEKYGFKKHGFADKVKEYLYAQNPIIPISHGFLNIHPTAAGGIGAEDQSYIADYVRLQPLVDDIGWEKAKEIPEVRQLLQRTGTEGGRRIFNPLAPNNTFWIKLLFAELDEKYGWYDTGFPLHKEFQSNLVISDCRFDNEAQAIRERGGLVILVESSRDGLPEPDAHASESGVDPFLIDGTLHNNGLISDLYCGVDALINMAKGQ